MSTLVSFVEKCEVERRKEDDITEATIAVTYEFSVELGLLKVPLR